MRKLNLVGETYGKLTVIAEAEPYVSTSGKKYRRWLCQCECGNETITRQASLRNGRTQSCGCYNKEQVKKTHTTHGQTRGKQSKEYQCWRSIKTRCYNQNRNMYPYYGGKDIIVAPEWINDFQAFYNHVGPASHPNASLDRIDNSKGYIPGNVRWTTRQVQSINRRTPKNSTSGHKGVGWHKKSNKWCARITFNGKRIHLGLFDTLEDAIAARKEAEERYHKPLIEVT